MHDEAKTQTVPDQDASAIRKCLDAYTEAVACDIRIAANPSDPALIPSHITGVRREYLETTRNNIIARQKYAAAVRDVRSYGHSEVDHSTDRQSLLHSRLGLLQKQQLNIRLTIIQHYFELFGAFTYRSHAEASQGHERAQFAVRSCNEVDSYLDHAKQLVAKLERTVIQADHEARMKKARLQKLQAQVDGIGVLDTRAQIEGLVAVRDALTAWVEESLATCASGVTVQDTQEASSGSRYTSEDVHTAYEKYLTARQRLLNVLEDLFRGTERPSSIFADMDVPAKEHMTLKDDLTIAEKRQESIAARHALVQMQAYVEDEIQHERAITVDTLSRLADESQLLPEYPILNRKQRFDKLIDKLGGGKQRADDDQIATNVEAWAFAADASSQSTKATLQKHLRAADSALDEVDELLRDFELLKGRLDTN